MFQNRRSKWTLIGVVLALGAPLGYLLLTLVLPGREIDPCALAYIAVTTPFAFGFFALILANKTEQFARLAERDDLTGLANRRAMQQIVQHLQERRRRSNDLYSLILFDFDHFKRVNDHFGHCVGDQVLHEMARVLRGAARDSDTVARVGGEEFLIICPATNESEATILAERIRMRISSWNLNQIGCSFKLTASAGVYCPSGKSDLRNVIDIVDHRLYAAKELGRNRVVGGVTKMHGSQGKAACSSSQESS